MKIIELAGAYRKLLFPSMPKSNPAEGSSVATFVKEYARGNISLQNGKFLTRKAHDKFIDDLKGYHFSV